MRTFKDFLVWLGILEKKIENVPKIPRHVENANVIVSEIMSTEENHIFYRNLDITKNKDNKVYMK